VLCEISFSVAIGIPYWVGSITALGLIFDILGASVLALPDMAIEAIRRLTYGGRLKIVNDNLIQGWDIADPKHIGGENYPPPRYYQPGGVHGFSDFIDLLKKRYSDEDDPDYTQEELSELKFIRTIQTSDYEDDVMKGVPYMPGDPAGLPTADFEVNRRNMLERTLQPEIERQDSRMRRAGILVLIFGFLHQFIANFVPFLVRTGHWQSLMRYWFNLTTAILP
jgi:hypothetical protein